LGRLVSVKRPSFKSSGRALGIVALAALGLTPVAFLLAGSVYAVVGLCYADLAAAYPVAGGGHYDHAELAAASPALWLQPSPPDNRCPALA